MKVRKRLISNLKEAKKAVELVGTSKEVQDSMAEKTIFCVLEIEKIPSPAANIIKQIAISRGTDAIVHKDVVSNKIENSTVLLPGTIRELKLISEELKKQPFGLKILSEEISKVLSEFEISKSDFLIMGVLNVTPDSFSDGGDYFGEVEARERFYEMIKEGADIIDIGAESSRPGSKRITVEEELNRLYKLFPLIEESPVPISIDTYKGEVAEAALSKGASIVNDISALRMDKKMVDVVRSYDSKVVLMHMKGTPETMQVDPYYEDVIEEIKEFFKERIDFCLSHGIKEDKIILDPGIGFGKRLIDNLMILSHLEEFTSYGFPLLVGASRKSFIGKITGEDFPKNRLDGSIATAVYSYLKGVSILRVHDVKETKNALSVIKAIKENRKND
ncbi:MAG: dihydropteroate synthase [candidate division WOR-3 bacterium]